MLAREVRRLYGPMLATYQRTGEKEDCPPYTEIARRLDTSTNTVWLILTNRTYTRPPGQRTPRVAGHRRTLEENWAIWRGLLDGKGPAQIADEIGLSRQQVQYVARLMRAGGLVPPDAGTRRRRRWTRRPSMVKEVVA